MSQCPVHPSFLLVCLIIFHVNSLTCVLLIFILFTSCIQILINVFNLKKIKLHKKKKVV
jgi:hypothetical protein